MKTNHKWTDKQIRSRSEHREYDTPTAAPPTSMAALRNSNPTSNQSLLGDPPSGSQLVLSATNTTLYNSPLSDVTKTVKNWIVPYESDGSANAAPILYRYLNEVEVDVTASVSKTGYHFNGSSTLHSKSTFTETDIGTNYVYRGLERQEPSSLNNWTETFVPVESHTGGITQSITHTKPAADNTITVPNHGTTTTVEPGGEHHSGTSPLSTYLTIQKPIAEFVGAFTTETSYVSVPTTTSNNNSSNGGDYSQTGGGASGDGTGGVAEDEKQTPGFRRSMFTGGLVPNRAWWESLDTFTPNTSYETNVLVAGVFARSLFGWVFIGEEAVEDHIVRSGTHLYLGDRKGFVEEQKNLVFGYADESSCREFFKLLYIDLSHGNVTTFASLNPLKFYGDRFEREVQFRSGTPGFQNGHDAAPLVDFVIVEVGMAPLNFIPGGAAAKGVASDARVGPSTLRHTVGRFAPRGTVVASIDNSTLSMNGLGGLRLNYVPGVANGKFAKWFDNLSADQLDQIWANPKLRKAVERRLRHPGGLHEWHMVSRAPTFKRWGLKADDIAEMRTLIRDVEFVDPIGRHGRTGSTTGHNELLGIIDSSLNYETFVRRLRTWASYRLKGGVDALPLGLR